MSNLLQAVKRIIENPIIEVKDFYLGRNRANSVGDVLENYVKDLFADTFHATESERLKKISKLTA